MIQRGYIITIHTCNNLMRILISFVYGDFIPVASFVKYKGDIHEKLYTQMHTAHRITQKISNMLTKWNAIEMVHILRAFEIKMMIEIHALFP